MSDLDTLSFEETAKVLHYSLGADQPITIEGPPGVGKTAMVNAAATRFKLPVSVLLLSQCEPTDVGGFPFLVDGVAQRLPLGPIKAACDQAMLLFLDELTTAAPAVQGAALRLIHERWAGDRRLHPGTRVVAAQNSADESAGGWAMSLPLIGRMTRVKLLPTLGEVQAYFCQLGKPGERLRGLAVEVAASFSTTPELLQLTPPRGAAATGEAWASPRAWERALRVLSTALGCGEAALGPVAQAILAGNIGPAAAAAWLGMRRLRTKLPSVEDVAGHPDTALVPDSESTCLATLAVVAQVALTDPCAALVYANRLPGEPRAAALAFVGRHFKQGVHASSPWFEEATAALRGMVRSLGEALRA